MPAELSPAERIRLSLQWPSDAWSSRSLLGVDVYPTRASPRSRRECSSARSVGVGALNTTSCRALAKRVYEPSAKRRQSANPAELSSLKYE